MSWTDEYNTTQTQPVNSCTLSCNGMLAENSPENLANYPEIQNTERQRQVMVVHLIRQGVIRFIEAYGRAPATYLELANAGLSPLAPGTINPLTGQPYAGLGGPNDFAFTCELNDEGWIITSGIYATDGEGGKVWQNCFLP